MIKLPRETIDNIFEPRREVNISSGLDLWRLRNRLLVDKRGRFYTIVIERAGHKSVPRWRVMNRPAPDWDNWTHCFKKGTYPVWVECEHDGMIPEKLWEVLPGPIHQSNILLAFYRIAFPRWDDIVKVEQWPTVSRPTWLYIQNLFAAFDRRMWPGVVPGGAWALGAGFSAARESSTMPDWVIDVSTCKVAYKDTPYHFVIRESRYGEQEPYSVYRPSIVWDVQIREDGLLMNESLDPTYEKPRCPASLEEAQGQCAQRAGYPLAWGMPSPRNEYGEMEWQSNVVHAALAA